MIQDLVDEIDQLVEAAWQSWCAELPDCDDFINCSVVFVCFRPILNDGLEEEGE